MTRPADGANLDYQLVVSKEGDKLDYLMRNKQSHEGISGFDDAASSSRKQIALPECDQVRTFILKEPFGLSEKYLPLWKREFIKDGNVIRTLMYAVRTAHEGEADHPLVPTAKDIMVNTDHMVEINSAQPEGSRAIMRMEGDLTLNRDLTVGLRGSAIGIHAVRFEKMDERLRAIFADGSHSVARR